MIDISNVNEKGRIENLPQNLGFLAKEVLSFKEALALLDISASMLYKLTHKRAINFYKPNGKLIYFKKEDLIGWMLGNKQETCIEVSNQLFENLKLRRA
jgi:excisionase family DNA binding protein